MEIKFDSDNDLPSTTLKIHDIIIVAWCLFLEGNKYYPQVFLEKCFYSFSE